MSRSTMPKKGPRWFASSNCWLLKKKTGPQKSTQTSLVFHAWNHVKSFWSFIPYGAKEPSATTCFLDVQLLKRRETNQCHANKPSHQGVLTSTNMIHDFSIFEVALTPFPWRLKLDDMLSLRKWIVVQWVVSSTFLLLVYHMSHVYIYIHMYK